MPHTPRNIQSPYDANDFWDKWNSVNPRMALFIKVIPVPPLEAVDPLPTIGFTSNSRDMTLPGHPGLTFRSAIGATPSIIEQKLNDAGSLEMTGIYQTGIFEREDVLSGRWDFATVEIFSACWETTGLGEFLHFKGNIGEFRDYEQYFTVEGRGLIGRLSNDAGVVTTRNCRVKQFRDAQCGFTGTTAVVNGTTYALTLNSPETAMAGDWFFIISAEFDGNQITTTPSGYPLPPTNFFNNGTLTLFTGRNAGAKREILKYEKITGVDENNVPFEYATVSLKRPFVIFDGDLRSYSIKLEAGCNRTLEDCQKYNNVINFRGEPFIPGIEVMNRIPPSQ